MKKLLFIFLFIIPLFLKGQSIEETIVYINNIFKEAYKGSPIYPNPFSQDARSDQAIVNSSRTLGEPIELKINYLTIAISTTGLMTISEYNDLYIIPKGTTYPEWLYVEPQKSKTEFVCKWEVYVKSLDTIVEGQNSYVRIYCNGRYSNNCIKYTYNQNVKDASFRSTLYKPNEYTWARLVNGEEEAKKCRNAFKHLIKLSKNKKEFYTKDPFSE